MLHTEFAGTTRKNILAAMGAEAMQTVQATRPVQSPFADAPGEELGSLTGYRYKRNSRSLAYALGIPGELADAHEEYFMDLSDGFPVEIRPGDCLRFTNGDLRRVSAAHGSGAYTGKDIYRLYRLEAEVG